MPFLFACDQDCVFAHNHIFSRVKTRFWYGSKTVQFEGSYRVHENLLALQFALLRFSYPCAAFRTIIQSPHAPNQLAFSTVSVGRNFRCWNTTTSSSHSFLQTLLQVCSFVWSGISNDLASCLGHSQQQIIVRQYLFLVKVKTLIEHYYRVLYFAMLPSLETIVTSADNSESSMLFSSHSLPSILVITIHPSQS